MKAIIIKDLKGRPLYIARVEELSDLDYLKKKKECEANLREDLATQESKEIAIDEVFSALEKEIKILKGEE